MNDMFVVQSEAGGFWCGYNSWNTQLRKAQIFVSGKYAKEVIERNKDLNPKIVPVSLSLKSETQEQGRPAVVVRCKDCKWFFQDADNEPCCRNVCGLAIVTDEDFCSLGERREDE